VVLLAPRSLSRLLLVMVPRICSKVSWLAVPLRVALVLHRRLKSSKDSLVCRDTCRLRVVRLGSTRLQLLLTTRSPMEDSPKDLVSTATVLNRRNPRLPQVQVSRTLVLVAALMVLLRLNRANQIRILAHLA
jgi:hypothetical protein